MAHPYHGRVPEAQKEKPRKNQLTSEGGEVMYCTDLHVARRHHAAKSLSKEQPGKKRVRKCNKNRVLQDGWLGCHERQPQATVCLRSVDNKM